MIRVETPVALPTQKLTDSEKRRKFGSEARWAEAVMDGIDELVMAYRGGLGDKRRLAVNLRLAEEGKFDMRTVVTLLEPYLDWSEYERRFPDVPTHYDIITPRLNLMRGEEMNRPFNFVVVDRSSEGLSRAQKARRDLVFAVTLQLFAREVETVMRMMGVGGQESGDVVQGSYPWGYVPYPPTDQEGRPITNVEEVDKYMGYGYSDMAEKVGNDVIRYLIQELGLEYWMSYGFLKYLATGIQVYYVGEEGGNPVVRVVDPLLFDCEFSYGTRFVEECSWAREVRYLTVSEVIDMFWEDLTEKEVEEIERVRELGFQGFDDLARYVGVAGQGLIRVARYEWQGLRKVGIVYRVDPTTGEITKEVVDEYTALEEGVEVYWYWVNERWEGYRIGDRICKRMRPMPRKLTSVDDLFRSYSSYVGVVEPYSFMDRIVPYQYLFNVVFHKLKLSLARDKGPAFVMDLAQIPNTDGWTLDRWMNILDTLNIAFINSYNEREGVRNSFNQFAMVDRSTASSVQYYIAILQFIVQFVADITGITKQREGQVQPRETASGIERSVTQSTAITEPWFYTHNEVKRRVLNRLLDEAKAVYKRSKKMLLVLDDLGKKYIDVVESFKHSELGVFVSNSSFDLKVLETLKQVAQVSLQQKEITLKDFITSMKSQSITEIEKILEAAERYNQEKQRQMEQMQQQSMMEIERMKMEMLQQEVELRKSAELEVERMKAEAEMELQRLKNEGAIEVARIGGEAKVLSARQDAEVDANRNQILDMVEREKLRLEREKMERQWWREQSLSASPPASQGASEKGVSGKGGSVGKGSLSGRKGLGQEEKKEGRELQE